MLKTPKPKGGGGFGFGGLQLLFLLPVEEKAPPEASKCSKRPSVPVMPISPCLSKERQFQATKPCRAPRSPSGPCGAPCAPQPRSPAELRAHPSHGALQSPGEVLFFDRQREKRIAGTPRLPFPCQAEGKAFRKRTACSHDCRFLDRQGDKGNRKHTPCSHDCLFLDRQGGNGIASTGHVPTTAFSSTMVTSKLGRSAAVPRGKLVPSPEGARNLTTLSMKILCF